jgi:hypothetical protein
MHVSKDSMWQGIWKILQNFLGTKQDLIPNKESMQVKGMNKAIETLLTKDMPRPALAKWVGLIGQS